MKTKKRFIRWFRHLAVGSVFLCQTTLVLLPTKLQAGDAPGVVEKTKETVKDATAAVQGAAKDAKESVQDAGRAVGKSFENLWQRVDESRLKHRNRDEIVAWVIMGVLVGAVAGMFTSLKSTGAGKVGRLFLGLAGAFIGGLVVKLAQINFGWGPVLIRYEELLFSLIGAIVLLVVARLIRSAARKKPSQQ